jgi:integrase
VLSVLQPIWTDKTETASRLRGRIENVLDWARVQGFREGENPARWKGHLDHLLAAPSRVQKIEHHAALPYGELPGFMATLRDQHGVAARALEFAILTAARTGEVLGATWSEVDLAEKIWTVPAGRMKARREHRVPLSARAVEILTELHAVKSSELVFGGITGRQLGNMALPRVLERIGPGDLTTHGFRSTFRDWCAERTSFPSEVAEMALAHAVGDKVEAAYRRGDLFLKRRELMDAWEKAAGY